MHTSAWSHGCALLPFLSSLLPSLPPTTHPGGDDGAKPASSSPRGFEPRRAQPAWDATAGSHPTPLHPSYVSPSPYCFPYLTEPGAQGDELFHRLLTRAGFPALAPSRPQGGLGDARTLVQFRCFCSQTQPAHATTVTSAHRNRLERPKQERRAFVLEIES